MSVGGSDTTEGQPLSVGDFMTVTLVDSTGKEYFEHHTSILIGEELKGMCVFNYEGTDKSDDNNALVKALGGISVGFDFIIDALSDNAGTYTDASGNDHQLMYVGFGNGWQNKGDNAQKEVLNTLTTAIADIKTINNNEMTFSKSDSIDFFGNDSWGLEFNVGIILDTILEKEGTKRGQFYFCDYVLLGNLNYNMYKEWEYPINAITLTFELTFKLGDANEKHPGVGIKWHFYNDSDEKFYMQNSDMFDILAADGLQDEGEFGITAELKAAIKAMAWDTIGVKGEIQANLANHVGHSEGEWNDYGKVILSPNVKLYILDIPIPLWEQSWEFPWSTDDGGAPAAQAKMMRAVENNLIAASVLYIPSSTAESVDYSYTQGRSGWNKGGSAARSWNLFGLFTAKPKAAESVEDTVLQEGFLSDSDISVQNLGEGKYLAAFLDVLPGADSNNALAAYWSLYNGSTWSEPVLLENDGTEDQLPVITPAGSKGYLVVWSNASKKFDANDPLSERLDSFNISGCFFDGTSMGEVMDITKNTEASSVVIDGALETSEAKTLGDLVGCDDISSDTSPHAVYYKDADGSEHMKVYYTKSEFDISKPEDGEVVGDLLNLYSLIAARSFDFEKDEWSSSYNERLTEQIKGQQSGNLATVLGAAPTKAQIDAAFAAYKDAWYGQEFLDLAPEVDVTEQLDEFGYWKAGTTASLQPVNPEVAANTMPKGGDAIAYNGLMLNAYTLDRGGMAQTTSDQQLYLQIYNVGDDEYHHPIQLTTGDAEISDIQFVRSLAPEVDGGAEGSKINEVTYLFWKEKVQVPMAEVMPPQSADDANNAETAAKTTTVTRVRCMDITALVGNERALIKDDTTVPNKAFYYINKAAGEDAPYTPASIVAKSTPKAEDEADFTSIGNFKVQSSADGRYTHVVWTQFVDSAESEEAQADATDPIKKELQLFVVRIDNLTGEMSCPVQVTNKENHYLSNFDFAVTADGNIDVLTSREFLTKQTVEVKGENGSESTVETWRPDPTTAELAFLRIKPSDAFTIGEIAAGETQFNADGEPAIQLDAALDNESFLAANGLVAEVLDDSGKLVWTSKIELTSITESNEVETEDGGVILEEIKAETTSIDTFDMRGGERLGVTPLVPVAADGSYAGTLRVRRGEEVLATREFSGKVTPTLLDSGVSVSIIERNKVELSTSFTNADAALATGEHTVTYGYINAEGKKVKLGSKKLDALNPGKTVDFSVEAEIPFANFASVKNEDGSRTDSCQFYVDVDLEGYDGTMGSLELTATPEQVALMEGATELSAVVANYTEDATLEAVKSFKADDGGFLTLLLKDKIAQNEPEFTNRFKVVWEPVDNNVATVWSDGAVRAHGKGTIKLRAYVMPANTASAVAGGGYYEEIDNYAYLPEALIKTFEFTLVVDGDSGGNTGGGNTDGSGGSGNTGSNTGGSSNTSGGKGNLPGTGDPAMALIAATAGVGILAAGMGLEADRRKKQGASHR